MSQVSGKHPREGVNLGHKKLEDWAEIVCADMLGFSGSPLKVYVNQPKSINFIITKTINMKGISYLTDEKNHKKAVVIELKTIEEKYEDVHEFIDVLVAESRKGGEAVSWDDAKKILRKKGKL